uniref:Methyltransferase type 11 domain-containing protein n=1 Tax=Anopheles culicifacies TaxID=139723 RepID=A0A182M4W9_9DIPT
MTSRSGRTDSSGRSAALERAYVHDVYENCEEPNGQIRPKVAQFLGGLEPGSLVCDVGCGNGRYLSGFNPLIYTIGVDRCYRLTQVAHGKGGEVAICDNLDLPFRDESFDAVLSLAVVHHFATTERRVGAIRELARILRIGGRVIITVWALEQRHRRFESQDVLVPWQPPRSKTGGISDDEDDDDFLPPYHAYTEDSTNSSRSAGDGDSSSLSSSSPGETCYSFVRRAIQKLAGSKRSPWFLESWSSRETKHDSSLDYEDAKDLPIELRRLEDFDDLPEPPLSAGLKSRSLGSILNPPPKTIVRSRSSVPSLGAQIPESKATPAAEPTPVSRRPKLVKQKQSLCDDVDYKFSDSSAQAYREHALRNESRVQLLRKQSSLNEELMAESRLREKERIRKRIQKQISLNESFLCRSLFTKRLQVIKEGFATKLKTSTGSLERPQQQQVQTNGGCGVASGGNGNSTCSGVNGANGGTNSVTDFFSSGAAINCMPSSSVPTSPLVMPCPTPAHSPAPPRTKSGCVATTSESTDGHVCFNPASNGANNQFTFEETVILPWQLEQQETTINEPALTSIGGEAPTSSAAVHDSAVCSKSTSSTITTTTITSPSTCSGKAASAGATSRRNSNTEGTSHSSPQKPSSQKITRQQIKDLPPIPKFRRSGNYPILRRQTSAAAGSSTAAPVPVPKLLSLELFNPETDDLDSDSSEPSSPDSIDSVISALRPSLSPLPVSNTSSTGQHKVHPSGSSASDLPGASVPTIPPLVEAAAVVAHKLEDVVDMAIPERLGADGKPLRFNGLLNSSATTATALHMADVDEHNSRQHLVDFAEKLSAQLLKELENEKKRNESFDEDDDVFGVDSRVRPSSSALGSPPIVDPYLKKLNGDLRDLNQLRAELRERRLMLANLSNLGSGVGLGGQFGGSNDSLGPSYGSSMAPIIQEETDDDEEFNELEDRRNSGMDSLSGSGQPSASPSVLKVTSSIKCKNLGGKTVDDFVIIPELDEDDPEQSNDTTLLIQEEDNSEEHLHTSEPERTSLGAVGTTTTKKSSMPSFESHASVDSWAHSTSTASLDSPSIGGSATHHRYYHVFREGELDALINHHVTSLHIVSSYYERASWCVVAEKVHVWTI